MIIGIDGGHTFVCVDQLRASAFMILTYTLSTTAEVLKLLKQ